MDQTTSVAPFYRYVYSLISDKILNYFVLGLPQRRHIRLSHGQAALEDSEIKADQSVVISDHYRHLYTITSHPHRELYIYGLYNQG